MKASLFFLLKSNDSLLFLNNDAISYYKTPTNGRGMGFWVSESNAIVPP